MGGGSECLLTPPHHPGTPPSPAQIILALGNYMNSSKRGAVYGFKLQSLDLVSGAGGGSDGGGSWWGSLRHPGGVHGEDLGGCPGWSFVVLRGVLGGGGGTPGGSLGEHLGGNGVGTPGDFLGGGPGVQGGSVGRPLRVQGGTSQRCPGEGVLGPHGGG